eukprot:GEZU01010611.1.p1 GENE.GEZU01010611.1~~GEZU01010611.1.p1  ORF type:complete len:753 (+),score=147.23 GEZU01010611.1:110-2368(+)
MRPTSASTRSFGAWRRSTFYSIIPARRNLRTILIVIGGVALLYFIIFFWAMNDIDSTGGGGGGIIFRDTTERLSKFDISVILIPSDGPNLTVSGSHVTDHDVYVANKFDYVIRMLTSALAAESKTIEFIYARSASVQDINSAGLQHATGRYLLFLSPEHVDEIEIGYGLIRKLDSLVAQQRGQNKFVIVGAELVSQQSELVVHAGVNFKLAHYRYKHSPSSDNNPFPFFMLRGRAPDYQRCKIENQLVDAISSEGMIVSGELFDRLHGFASLYMKSSGWWSQDIGKRVTIFEAMDFCLRAKQRFDTPTYYSPNVVVTLETSSPHLEEFDVSRFTEPGSALQNRLDNLLTTWGTTIENIISKRYKTNLWLYFSAPFTTPSGFANEGIQYLNAIENIVPLNIRDYNENNDAIRAVGLPKDTEELLVILRNRTPVQKRPVVYMELWTPMQYNPPQGVSIAYSIGRFMFETDRVPATWLDNLRRVDEVWVPSKFNVETFAKATGFPRDKFKVVPQTLDFDYYDPKNAEPMAIEGKASFNFLSVFEWTDRKGWDIMLQAYFEEFSSSDDVALIIKSHLPFLLTPDEAPKIRKIIDDFVKEKMPWRTQNLPKVIIIGTRMAQAEFPRLYRSADAFVLPTRGEGWGRPFMEAMAMELPVIATGWSGNMEYMNEEVNYLIDYELVPCVNKDSDEYKGHMWAQASVPHLRKIMRHVFNNRDEARVKGKKARQHLIKNFSPEVVSNIIIERLRSIEEKLSKK